MWIDDQFMNDVGLADMPEDEKRAFMAHAEEELEVRVGQSIGAELSDAQMDEFEQLTDDRAATAWLEQNAPNFRETVARVFQAFKRELQGERQQIIS